jgi:hypothetical protein
MSATNLEISALWAQWVGAGSALLAVGVAVVFGVITLNTSRRSKDTQERATLTAAEPISVDFAQAVVAVSRVNWQVSHYGGEQWLLINTGNSTAHDVELEGMTETDRKRLNAEPYTRAVGPTGSVAFTLISRFGLSGPFNIVVRFALEAGGDKLQQIVRVPAP